MFLQIQVYQRALQLFQLGIHDRTLRAGQDDKEFVAAHPSDELHVTEGFFQRIRKGGQQTVTLAVAE